jgi:hypothetical protein
MTTTWADIVQYFRELPARHDQSPFGAAIRGLDELAAHISGGRLDVALFGWTSVNDLCIQQVDVPPYSVPYLRISPQQDGMIEFRYLDTAISDRQWSRRVPPEGVVGRLDAFLVQLSWIACPHT